MRGFWLGLVLLGCSSVDDGGLHGGTGETGDSGATLPAGGAPGSAGNAGVRTLGRLAGGATSGAAGSGAGGAAQVAAGGHETGSGGTQVMGSGGAFGSGGAALGSGGAIVSAGGALGSGGSGTGGSIDLCPGGQKRCQADWICRRPSGVYGCGMDTACIPCPVGPPSGYAICSGTTCDFTCLGGFVRVGNNCRPPGGGQGGQTSCGGSIDKLCNGYCVTCPSSCPSGFICTQNGDCACSLNGCGANGIWCGSQCSECPSGCKDTLLCDPSGTCVCAPPQR